MIRVWEQPPLSTKDEWTSVLKVANVLTCRPLQDMAVQRLKALTTPIDKIVLSRAYAIQEWVEDSYLDITEAKTLPSLNDCRRLGLDTLYELSRAREMITCSGGVIWSAIERRALILGYFRDTSPAPSPPSSHPTAFSAAADAVHLPGGSMTCENIRAVICRTVH
jgi:hypothetical protein